MKIVRQLGSGNLKPSQPHYCWTIENNCEANKNSCRRSFGGGGGGGGGGAD